MLSIWRKNRTLLTSALLILFISGCGLKGPLYQTPEKTPQQQATTNSSDSTPSTSKQQEKATAIATTEEKDNL